MSYKHILVAVDLTEPSDVIIARAVSMAKNLDAKLSFINVDISHPDGEVRDYDREESKILNREHVDLMAQLQQITELVDYPVANTLIVDGEVEEKLLDTVNELNADLLVSGHHHGFWNRWWSSAHKLVNIATVDLLLISL
jgi:universal stress protein A